MARVARNILHVKGMLHHIHTTDGNLDSLVGVREEQDLLVKGELPAVITTGLSRDERLVEGLPDLSIRLKRTPRCLSPQQHQLSERVLSITGKSRNVDLPC